MGEKRVIQTEQIRQPERYEPGFTVSKDKLNYALNEALKKIDGNLKTFRTMFPSHASENNVYFPMENNDGWNEGFWSGILWLAYELTGKETYKKTALAQIPTYTKRITEKLGVNHHDMGFLFTPSCVAAYKLTGNVEAKNTALLAAKHLVSRYCEKGKFIQAWGNVGEEDSYRLIIDCMLNIPLLYWAAEVTGDASYDEMAFNHFNTTADNIIRSNGSTYHTFYFDKETGAPKCGATHQGFSDDSTWSRGQAWGIYGLMLTHMYKKNRKAEELFVPVANYYLNRLPDDYVAYWDLYFTEGSEPRDSSSAAISACGLLEAAEVLNDEGQRATYLSAANHIMNSLIDNYLTKDIPESNGLLLHATYSKPHNGGVDECNIWGDYFYMEALARMITKNKIKAYW